MGVCTTVMTENAEGGVEESHRTDDERRERRRFDRRDLLKVLASGVAAGALYSTEVRVPESPPVGPDVRIPFDGEEYADRFTSAGITEHNEVREGPDGVERSLSVGVPEGDNYGTRMRYRFAEAGEAEPEQLHSRYMLYVPSESDVGYDDSGKLPGPAGTYGRAGWGGRPSDGTNGWSARMNFRDPDSDDGHVMLASYVYHAGMDGEYGTHFEWDIDDHGLLEADRWYRIDNYVRLNTPGEDDGVVRGWVDGDLALDETDIRFRDVDRLKVQGFWFSVYYGGDYDAPGDVEVCFDDLRLWKSRLYGAEEPT